MKKTIFSIALMLFATVMSAQSLKINNMEYFERQGVNILTFTNGYHGGFNDEKLSGIEIIHHGVRTAQGGSIRLNNTPEQWDLVPDLLYRNVDAADGSIQVGLRFPYYDFDSKIIVKAKGEGVEISVWLDKPVPEAIAGEAGFNLEFLPAEYWSKSYIMDGSYERFPRYAASSTITRPNSEKPHQFKGFRTYDDRGTGTFVDPLPFAKGHELIIAPEAPERMVKVSSDLELNLFDGRILAQNGWFVLRSILPAGKTGKVLTWMVEPNAIKGWIREPNIGFNQAGYMPDQDKLAVIELDKLDKVEPKASIMKINSDGTESTAYTGDVKEWGRYFRYNYAHFDFSSVKEPGVYYIQYGSKKSENFIISKDVYKDITYATSDVWIPIHMSHIAVNEGYRMWHGEPYREGYLQAPPSDHFDGHSQPTETGTKYKPLELIPGLNVGGFFDAGDFDIETGSVIGLVQSLVNMWDLHKPMRDETFIDEEQRYVDIHRPDGKPDILQFIEHGTLNILAQAENIGFMATTLSNSVLDNYHHLGDAATITDGLHYDPSLKPYEISADGLSSGTPDDMWAFTGRDPNLDYRAATVLAAAGRVLRGFNDDIANRSLRESKRLMDEAGKLLAKIDKSKMAEPDTSILSSHPHHYRGEVGDISTYLQLYVATGEKQYRNQFLQTIWPALDKNVRLFLPTALDAVPNMDESYRNKLRPYIEKYKAYCQSLAKDNPYGVPIGLDSWAGTGGLVYYGSTVGLASTYYPDIIDKSFACKVADYLFGCHPYHNYSLVAGVGNRQKNVFYGNNRADYAAIPGNMAPGLLFHKPDFFENQDNSGFIWAENEGTIANNAAYLNFGMVFKSLVEQ